jgi:hypothetical protein
LYYNRLAFLVKRVGSLAGLKVPSLQVFDVLGKLSSL